MAKKNNLGILILLIGILVTSFLVLSFYIYKKTLNEKNKTIMLSKIKQSINDRNYQKAYSIAQILKNKYPNNNDINILEDTLAEISGANPFESKDNETQEVKDLLDKIENKTPEETPKQSQLAFNNEFVEEEEILENYAQRENKDLVEVEDFEKIKKEQVPQKIIIEDKASPKTKEVDNIFDLNLAKEEYPTPETEINIGEDISSLKEPKEEPLTQETQTLPKVQEEPEVEKAPEVVVQAKPIPTPVKIDPVKTQTNSIKDIIEIKKPYQYAVRKELYEILDEIKTSKIDSAISRINTLIEKGIGNEFKEVRELLDSNEINRAENAFGKLIKK